ncbi:hypothetical protein DSCO28_65890 [Desulfosarcina ovata subsp. sediminis]|uniref:Uncharacterized protein n=1 Tax=Desulfosarcina ovata subsp. sediminis TaxID=885957 RepID=A0A5K8A0I5_9BACT|nr:hypothetical protein [Desulfosarcina ovata]BBO86023.1 hypothetical protein DSCO28_65890 [Desulfosarcina ovata subsp. sediminis]
MNGLLINNNGGLKTGRVAILVFAAVIILAGMLFQLGKPLKQAAVVVTHVFEPEEAPQERVPPPAETRQTDQRASPLPEAVSGPSPMVEAEESGMPQRDNPESKTSAAIINEVLPEKSHETGSDQPVPPSVLQKETDLNGSTKTSSALAAGPPDAVPEVAETHSVQGAQVKDSGFPSVRSEPSDGRFAQPPAASDNGNGDISAGLKDRFLKNRKSTPDSERSALVVDSDRYVNLFRSWRKAGGIDEKGEQKIPLRVENLRNTYHLFQMKPVAVVGNQTFVDLSDGSRIPEGALAAYSGTVFLVDRPWSKWGEILKKSGIRQSEAVEVRYYMHGFIKRAIYTRANRAFEWCKTKGLIAPETPQEEVDVLGRVYAIKRPGKGQFGVFVPVLIDTVGGKTVTIDPECFNDQADVQALGEAGVL